MKKSIALIGAGGHCKVIIDLLNELNEYDIVGIYDDNKEGVFSGINILGKTNELDENIDNFIISIGNDKIRKKIYESHKNLNWCRLIHPKSIVSKTAKIDIGTVVLAGAVIQTEVQIGKHCIINTNCNIDHESIVGDFCNICPGTTICGLVNIGESTFVGANSTIIQTIKIGNDCLVGAGTVIIRDIPDGKKVVGNPARYI